MFRLVIDELLDILESMDRNSLNSSWKNKESWRLIILHIFNKFF